MALTPFDSAFHFRSFGSSQIGRNKPELLYNISRKTHLGTVC